METRTLLMIGDVIGEAGIRSVERSLAGLKAEYGGGLVVVNGENAADGFGMTACSAERILSAGADVITSGNHIWEKRDFLAYMNGQPRIIRPANYPDSSLGAEYPHTPGRGFTAVAKDGISWLVVNLQGREFMTALDCPFKAFDAVFNAEAAGRDAKPVVVVDFHAESALEKESLALYLDGRAAVVAGTHTHVQTADERLLPKGTAYITDLGMSGAADGIIGMDAGICLQRVKTQVLYKLECASGAGVVQGIAVRIDKDTGAPVSIDRFCRESE
jgi:metallophosphoesterase (TIGR00282 family)